MQANQHAAGQQVVGLGSLIAYGQVCTIQSHTVCTSAMSKHATCMCLALSAARKAVSCGQSSRHCTLTNNWWQSLQGSHISYDCDINFLQVNCEVLVPHHACRSVSIMTDASGFTAWFLSHCLLVRQQQGQQAYLDTECSCLCTVSNVTGCDDVYTSSKASPCTGAHHVKHSSFNTTVACLFWCLSR